MLMPEGRCRSPLQASRLCIQSPVSPTAKRAIKEKRAGGHPPDPRQEEKPLATPLQKRLLVQQAIDGQARLCAHKNVTIGDRRHTKLNITIKLVACRILFAIVQFYVQVGGIVGP